jgi:nitroreductase
MAAMILMNAAHAKGLVSGAMIGFDATAVSTECKLAVNEIPVMLIAVGNPAPGNWPSKVRRAVNEVVRLSAD